MRGWMTLIVGTWLVACGGEAAEPAASEAPMESTGDEAAAAPDEGAAEEAAAATQPDLDKLRKHVAEHLKVPATRDEILAACAQTTEFTEGEKAWIAEKLTAERYETTDDVSQALGL